KLPESVIAAFGSPHVIGISHAAKLAPVLRAPLTRKQVEGNAEVLAVEQACRRSANRKLVGSAQVVARLLERKKRGPEVRRAVIKGADLRVLARGERA